MRTDAKPLRKLTPIEQAAQALAQLSDAEWVQVKCDEDRRRNATAQRHIRALSAKLRDLRRGHRGGAPRKIDPAPPR
jgi:hypothetical protein